MKKTTKRLLCGVVSVLLLLTAAAAFPVSALDGIEPGVRFYTAFSDTLDGPVLSCTVQVKGMGLVRTQFISLAYDRSVLTLIDSDIYSADGALSEMPAPLFAPILTLENDWDHELLPVYAAASGDGKTGYLFLYPTRDDPFDAAAYRNVLTLEFALRGVLPETLEPDEMYEPDETENYAEYIPADSLRLLTADEQKAFGQSVRLALCDAENVYTLGASAGGDTLSEVTFSGALVSSEPHEEQPSEEQPSEEQPSGEQTQWINPFTDVPADAPYLDAIAYVNREGLFIGTSDTTFDPDGDMTRATFATVLCRLAGEEETAKAEAEGKHSAFSDVKDGAWYLPYVLWAEKTGLFLGDGDGNFMPEQKITHEQMYLLLQRFAEEHGFEIRAYEDVSLASVADEAQIHDWALSGVRFAFANGLLIADSENTIRPREDAKRWELSAALYEFSLY